jgi:hypothetical protein
MTKGSPTPPNRDALLQRVEALRTRISSGTLRALTDGREPHELPDDRLRNLVTVIERALPEE